MGKKKVITGKINYDNEGNGSFIEWWQIDEDRDNKWMKEFENKKVKITIEELK